MDRINDLITRVRVIATSAVTVLTVLTGVVAFVISQVDITQVQTLGAQLLAVLGGLILVIRRVSPAPPDQRGIL